MGILSNHTEPKCNGELFEFTFTAFPRAHLNTPTYAEIFHLHNLVVGRIKASHTMKESYLSNIIDGQFPREKYIYRFNHHSNGQLNISIYERQFVMPGCTEPEPTKSIEVLEIRIRPKVCPF